MATVDGGAGSAQREQGESIDKMQARITFSPLVGIKMNQGVPEPLMMFECGY
jgi:hypothetical protein